MSRNNAVVARQYTPKQDPLAKGDQPLFLSQTKGQISPSGKQVPQIANGAEGRNRGELVGILAGCKLVDLAVDIAAVVKMPSDTAILSMLGVASSVVGMNYRTEYQQGGAIPVGIYVACEQPPATGKSGLLSMMQKPIFDATKRLREQNKEFAGFLTDATPEGMESTLLMSGGQFMLASTEQSLINSLLGLSYKDKGNSSNNSLILEGYSGDWHAAARVGRKGYVGNVHGSLTIISQGGTIDKILGSSNGTGIAERFFLFAEPDLLGTRDHRISYQRNTNLQEDFAGAVDVIFDNVISRNRSDKAGLAEIRGLVLTGDDEADKGIQQEIDKLCAPLRQLSELECLHVTAASWDYINQQKNEVEELIGAGGPYESDLMRSYAGKLDQRVLKVAAVLHVMESLMAGQKVAPNIEHRFIEMAVHLARWSNEQVYRIATDKQHIGRPAEHDAIISWMITKNGPVKETAITQHCRKLAQFKRLKTPAEAVKLALEELVRDGVLSLSQVGLMGGNGKSATQYEII